ncbi:MAG: Nramp family divalent metal transporter [Acidobacteriia bacterium]|nr:Nramp family divalent metal transporter [Terriglobia bacterium]
MPGPFDDRGALRPLRSLSEVHESVEVPRQPSFWRRLFAFSGPAYLVSVGYMDPGNWATDIAAGSRFGYALIWVLLMSNLMAVLLQSLSARLGIVTGLDLAQACRAMYSRRISWALWILCEVAIAACDLAEVLGSAIGLKLLFGIPLVAGVLITALDTLLILVLHGRGVRMMEAVIVVLITTIGLALAVEIVLSRPEWGGIVRGLAPVLPGPGSLYLAIGILGATVMPHNLYLHSALVQSRRILHTPTGIRSGVRFNVIDSVVALNGAFVVNAALLVMAAATFHRAGFHDVAEIQDAHRLLEPILGAAIAPVAFAVALIASGQSSTITGTLAGQIVMEGFLQLRLRPFVRRLLTRSLAIVPALVVILALGERSTGDLLLLSQVVLSLQLSFAVIPLIHLVSDRRWMGQYAIRPTMQAVSWIAAAVIVALNLWLAWEEISRWLVGAGRYAWLLWMSVVPASLGLLGLLGYVVVVPAMQRRRGEPAPVQPGVHGRIAIPEVAPPRAPRRIAAAVDFSPADGPVLSHAVTVARSAGRGSAVVLLHVVESGGARLMGDESLDGEARADQERLEMYAGEMRELGVDATYDLGFGEPAAELALLVERHRPELVVVGSHGHRGVGDFVHGTTVERLRHRIAAPVLVVPFGSSPSV